MFILIYLNISFPMFPHLDSRRLQILRCTHEISIEPALWLWGPPVMFVGLSAPVTIVISTINHSYWSYKPT